LDRVLAESLEPRVLYSAAPAVELALSAEDWMEETVHVARAWNETEAEAAEGDAIREHVGSHGFETGPVGPEWDLVRDWIRGVQAGLR
jgi:hypothetical protein